MQSSQHTNASQANEHQHDPHDQRHDPQHPQRRLGLLRHDGPARQGRLAARGEAVSEATGESHEAVRRFLDAAPGRHFADDVHNAMHGGLELAAAIDAATRKWMGWTISARASRQHGIPRGLPYLTGFVIHCDLTSNDE